MSTAAYDLKPDSHLGVIKQGICNTAALPLGEARALPAEAYTDPHYFEWEKEHILKKQWLSVAHVSQVPNPGDYINLDMLGESISVVRGQDNQIRVLSRVCVHRGMDIMPPEFGHGASGNCQSFKCPYHHWVYGLDGNLKGAPFMKQHKAVVNDELKLHEFNSATWEGFVFVNLSGTCEPLTTQFDGMEKYLERWDMAGLEMVADIEWDCHFNWKVLVENFMEPYHHAGAHHTIFQPTLPAQHCWTEPEQDYYSVCHLPLDKQLQEKVKAGEPQLIDFLPMPSIEYKDYLEWTVYLGAPTMLLFVAADRVYWYRLQPLSADRMALRTTLLLHPDAKQMTGYQEKLDEQVELAKTFHMEDMEVCSALQIGLKSDVYKPGPLCQLEEPIWQFQRYLARQIKSAL